MTTRTRYFVIASLLVLTVGVGTGLLAYYVGGPGGFLADGDGADELRYVPQNAAIVAYADVRDIMGSDVRQRIRRAMPGSANGQAQFQEQTGINIESDIDHVVASFQPQPDGTPAGLVLARGRFSDVKIEALMRGHGAEVEEYNGKRVIVQHDVRHPGGDTSLTFLEPGLIAVGSGRMVQAAIDVGKSGENVTQNTELMGLVRALDRGNAWAVGRLDVLTANGRLPEQIASRLPAITWFSISGRIDSDIEGTVRADTRDEEAAANLRDVIRGFVALAKLQAANRPELQTVVQSLVLGGTGRSVALKFSVPGAVFDAFVPRPEAAEKPPAH
jgi:hypothetical protein